MVLLTDIIHSVYLLLQKDKCFVNQFIESGGLLPIKNYKIFNEDNVDDLIISYLLIISFICKGDGKYYNVLSSMNILNELLPLFDSKNTLVKSNVFIHMYIIYNSYVIVSVIYLDMIKHLYFLQQNNTQIVKLIRVKHV